MNYEQIIVHGFNNKETRNYLKNYFVRKAKEAYEKHYSYEEFFGNCLDVIDGAIDNFRKYQRSQILGLKSFISLCKSGRYRRIEDKFLPNQFHYYTVSDSADDLENTVPQEDIDSANEQLASTYIEPRERDYLRINGQNFLYSYAMEVRDAILQAKEEIESQNKPIIEQEEFLKSQDEETTTDNGIKKFKVNGNIIAPFLLSTYGEAPHKKRFYIAKELFLDSNGKPFDNFLSFKSASNGAKGKEYEREIVHLQQQLEKHRKVVKQILHQQENGRGKD